MKTGSSIDDPLHGSGELDRANRRIGDEGAQRIFDREQAVKLFGLAIAQFNEIGMPGWTRRAEELLRECGR